MKNAIAGRPIIDAKGSLSITITKADIKRADTKEPANCAAAIACRREHKVAEARIHLGRVYIRQNKGNWLRYMTPRALRAELIAFDRGGTFSPGTYVLGSPPPGQTAKRGKRAGTKPRFTHARSNPHRRPRAPRHVVDDVRGGPAA